MKSFRIVSFSFLLLVFLLSGCGGGDLQPPPPVGEQVEEEAVSAEEQNEPPSSPAINLTGIWEGVLTHEAVEGECPPTPGQQGTVLISQEGTSFTMEFDEGFDCDPIEACAFTGEVSGLEFTASNGGVITSDGGTYTTTMTLAAASPEGDAWIGTGTSIYSHPELTCVWNTSLSLIRAEGE